MISTFTQKVIKVIQSIPYGRVSTYGVIAIYADNPRGARQVSRILHSSSRKYALPWHRVVNKKGSISLPRGGGYEKQKALLLAEDIIFDENDVIDLDTFLWWPQH